MSRYQSLTLAFLALPLFLFKQFSFYFEKFSVVSFLFFNGLLKLLEAAEGTHLRT